jgi:hypothetical protein
MADDNVDKVVWCLLVLVFLGLLGPAYPATQPYAMIGTVLVLVLLVSSMTTKPKAPQPSSVRTRARSQRPVPSPVSSPHPPPTIKCASCDFDDPLNHSFCDKCGAPLSSERHPASAIRARDFNHAVGSNLNLTVRALLLRRTVRMTLTSFD